MRTVAHRRATCSDRIRRRCAAPTAPIAPRRAAGKARARRGNRWRATSTTTRIFATTSSTASTEPLVEVTGYGYRTKDGYQRMPPTPWSFYRDVAQLVGELAAESRTAPAQIDRDGTHLKAGEAVVNQRWMSYSPASRRWICTACASRRGARRVERPPVWHFLNAEMLARADVSVMTHHSFHGGMAMAMLAYSVHRHHALRS